MLIFILPISTFAQSTATYDIEFKSIDLKTIEVYNVLGRLVKQILIDKGISKLNIDLSHLNNGIYLLKLKATNEQTKTQKLIIN